MPSVGGQEYYSLRGESLALKTTYMTSRGVSHQLPTKMDLEASGRAHRGQWLAAKPEDLGSISRTHFMKREN